MTNLASYRRGDVALHEVEFANQPGQLSSTAEILECRPEGSLMYWTDLELSCIPTEDELRVALAESFAIAPTAIQIVDDIDQATPVADRSVGIVALRYHMPGDLPLHVELFLREHGLAELVGRDPGSSKSAEMIRAIAANLACAIVTSGPELDPWEWLLYTGDGHVERIHADPYSSSGFVLDGAARARLRKAAATMAA